MEQNSVNKHFQWVEHLNIAKQVSSRDGVTWPGTFTKLGKEIAIAVKAGGPEPENNPRLRAIIATCKRGEHAEGQYPARY